MKKKIKRFLLLTFFVIGILFSLTILFKGINRIVYKSVIPIRFQTAFWEGRWSNSETSFISGNMKVALPYTLPLNKDTNVDMIVYYNLWSIYNPCGTREFSIKCFISDNKSTNGNVASTDSSESIDTKGKSFYFSAKILNGAGQSIDYNGLINSNFTKITGGYISTNPDDYGEFILKRI